MRIFAVDESDKKRKIFGTGISKDRLPEKIITVLEITEGCNLFNFLIVLAKIKIDLAKGFSYVAYVVDRRYVNIYFLPNKRSKFTSRTDIIQFIGDEKISPEELKIAIEKAARECIEKAKKIREKRKGDKCHAK